MVRYSDIIPDYWFNNYKKLQEEDRRDIEDKVFKAIREVNIFPNREVEGEQEYRSLRNLTTLDVYSIYDNNIIMPQNSGVDFLYKFYPNINDVKKKDSKMSMREGFFDDKVLKRAIRKCLLYDESIDYLRRWFYLVGCGACSNFRPSAARVVYDINLGEGSRVYDFSSGYGGRLLGAWASEKVVEYVGIDPNTETYNNAVKLIKYLNKKYKNGDMSVFCEGSENFGVSKYPEYENYFDMAFSSPQYFDTEIYCEEETQSCFKFPTYESWIKYFLRYTVHNCIDVLKEDGIFAINIFDKLNKIKPILQYICKEKDFYLYKVDKLALHLMPGLDTEGEGRKSKGAYFKYEPIFYFKRRGA